jgi:hypothetical protein
LVECSYGFLVDLCIMLFTAIPRWVSHSVGAVRELPLQGFGVYPSGNCCKSVNVVYFHRTFTQALYSTDAGECNGEGSALAGFAFDLDLSLVILYDDFGDRQP